MNALAAMLSGEGNDLDVVKQRSRFHYGAHIILRHNTTEEQVIIDGFKDFYQVAFQQIRGVKVISKEIESTPRVPVDFRIRELIRLSRPLSASSLQQTKDSNGDLVYLSHHFLWGLHWDVMSGREDEFSASLGEALTTHLKSVDNDRRNVLIKSLGDTNPEDMVTESNLFEYLTYGRERDTLISHMTDKSPLRKFSVYYQYTD